MIRTSILNEMESLIPKGERSHFVDSALEQASQLEWDFDAKDVQMGLSLVSWWEQCCITYF